MKQTRFFVSHKDGGHAASYLYSYVCCCVTSKVTMGFWLWRLLDMMCFKKCWRTPWKKKKQNCLISSLVLEGQQRLAFILQDQNPFSSVLRLNMLLKLIYEWKLKYCLMKKMVPNYYFTIHLSQPFGNYLLLQYKSQDIFWDCWEF